MQNPDGTVALDATSGPMLAPTQADFEACCCGSGPGAPCTDCSTYRLAASVVMGGCGADADCNAAGGAYPAGADSTFADLGDFCEWMTFRGPDLSPGFPRWYISVSYFKPGSMSGPPNTFSIQIKDRKAPGFNDWYLTAAPITCNKATHKLTGTMTLIFGMGGVRGSTATVTLI